MTLDGFVFRPALCCRYLVRLSSHHRAAALALALGAMISTACGTDAERRYAGLSEARSELEQAGYVLRYLAPPWGRVDDDPLATGARKSVQIGGMSTDIVPDSGTVLEIAHESNTHDSDVLTFPKYRLEAALVPCAAEDVQGSSCAAHLAELDYAARQEDAPFDLFGPEPRERENDAGQRYYELMGQDPETLRYRRVVFVEGDVPEEVAGWLLFEANPDLGEREIDEFVDAFQMLPGSEAEP